MSTPLKSVLVFGATGVIGKYITAALIEASFDRLAIFTSPSTLSNKAAEIQILKSKGVEIIIGDVTNKEDVLQAYNDNTGLAFDTVVSCVGRNVIKAQIDLIKWAEESAPGIKHFFPSEYGTDIEYGPKSAAEKPHQAKLAVRAYIRESVRRLEYTYLVTGPYADLYIGVARANPKAGTFDVKGKKATLLGTGEESVSLTTMKDVGRLLVAAVRNPAASRNRALIVNSFTTTPNEILSEFERQTASKWSVDYTPLDELKGVEEDAWANGVAHATGITLRRIWTEGGTLYKSNDNGVVNVSPSDVDTLADAVSKAVAVASGG